MVRIANALIGRVCNS